MLEKLFIFMLVVGNIVDYNIKLVADILHNDLTFVCIKNDH